MQPLGKRQLLVALNKSLQIFQKNIGPHGHEMDDEGGGLDKQSLVFALLKNPGQFQKDLNEGDRNLLFPT